MNFDMSDDRRMLADSLTRFLADKYAIDHRNAVAYEAPYHDPTAWQGLSELGILQALVPEESGGFGGSGFDLMAVFEPLGRVLSAEPVLPALMAARLLGAAGANCEALLDGTTKYAVAIGELDAPYALEDVSAEAVVDGENYRISGRKSVVYGGQVAGRFLVAARDAEGLHVFEVSASDAAVTGFGMIDGGGAAELFLDQTPATLLLRNAEAALQDALDAGALALCAEAIGAMDGAYALLLDYMKTRKQFGRTIGSFQALQHRMVDLTTEMEQARSITILAASRMGTEDQSRTVSMAKNLIGRTVKLVAEESIQMQGGIAMTWEYPASHYAKRLTMIDHQLGDTDFHLERVMAAHRAG